MRIFIHSSCWLILFSCDSVFALHLDDYCSPLNSEEFVEYIDSQLFTIRKGHNIGADKSLLISQRNYQSLTCTTCFEKQLTLTSGTGRGHCQPVLVSEIEINPFLIDGPRISIRSNEPAKFDITDLDAAFHQQTVISEPTMSGRRIIRENFSLPGGLPLESFHPS